MLFYNQFYTETNEKTNVDRTGGSEEKKFQNYESPGIFGMDLKLTIKILKQFSSARICSSRF